MKVVVQVRLFPDRQQEAALRDTLATCNTVANRISEEAWHQRVFSPYPLHHLTYQLAKAQGLAAQAAVRTIKKVADAYRVDRKTKRTFRPLGAQPFDDRCLSWQVSPDQPSGTVSIWTTHGRMKGVRFGGSPQHVALLRKHRKGQTDLVCRGGKWFLHATCEVEEEPRFEPRGWLGVDLGIVNIATTSDGDLTSGKALNRRRHRNRRLRAKLQRRGTKSAKRLLKKRSKKEKRFANDVNHRISKTIVAEAKRTRRGIAIEDLRGIRARVRLRKPQRATLHSWAFHQLGEYLAYKAEKAGVPLVRVDPKYTSQTCADCGHLDRANRRNQSEFECRSCGVVAHADRNAARNIAMRGAACWADVNRPHAA
ncbi:MAG TPA: transposase [Actinomycetales bacterium]|jgi:IS605 OrfB family transposase|nr:transposase [Actinomycetales bacterium]